MEGFRVVVCAEYPTAPNTEIESFFATISLTYDDVTKESMKILSNYLFIMDTSGSMDGKKIENLKNSILCVLPMLTNQDRMALIYFNGCAEILSDLKFMTEPNKKLVRDCLLTLKASGGTSILAGLKKGLSLLKSQGNDQHNWCVFLLTDGQDREDVNMQYEIAAEIQRCGGELFIFGFGSDHDNVHLDTLATKSNTMFAFIDTDQHIRDYFSASVGLHQSCSLKDVQLFVEILSDGVCLQECKAGSYKVNSNGNCSSVLFPDIKNGEERYILVRLNLPAVPNPVEKYGLFTAHATYTIMDGRTKSATNITEKRTCFVDRIELTDSETNQTRSLAVDTEINVQEAAKAMQEAIQAADLKNTSHAAAVITNASEQIKQSISFESHEIKSVTLVQDLEETKVIVSIPTKYEAGGRAQMSDALSQIRFQRCICPRRGREGIFQTKSAAEAQKAAEIFSVQLSRNAGIIAEFDSLLDAATAMYDSGQQMMLSLQEQLEDFEERARNLFTDASFQHFWKDYIKQLFQEGNLTSNPPLDGFAIAAEPALTPFGGFAIATETAPSRFVGHAIAAQPAPTRFGGNKIAIEPARTPFGGNKIAAKAPAPTRFGGNAIAAGPASTRFGGNKIAAELARTPFGGNKIATTERAPTRFGGNAIAAGPAPRFGSFATVAEPAQTSFANNAIAAMPASFCDSSPFRSAPVAAHASFGSASSFGSRYAASFSPSISESAHVTTQPSFGSKSPFDSRCAASPSCSARVATQPAFGSTSPVGLSCAASGRPFCSVPVAVQPFGTTSPFDSTCTPAFGAPTFDSSSAPLFGSAPSPVEASFQLSSSSVAMKYSSFGNEDPLASPRFSGVHSSVKDILRSIRELAVKQEETHRMEIQNLRVEFECSLKEREVELQETKEHHLHQIEEFEKQKQAELLALKEEYQQQLEHLQEQKEAELLTLREEHQQQVQWLDEQKEAELSAMKEEHQKELEKFEQQKETELHELKVQHQKVIDMMQADLDQKTAELLSLVQIHQTNANLEFVLQNIFEDDRFQKFWNEYSKQYFGCQKKGYNRSVSMNTCEVPC